MYSLRGPQCFSSTSAVLLAAVEDIRLLISEFAQIRSQKQIGSLFMSCDGLFERIASLGDGAA